MVIRKRKNGQVVQSTPLTPAELVRVRGRMPHHRTWQCPCGSTMTIRSYEPRADGASQLQIHAGGDRQGHAIIPAHLLNWAELAAERGWRSDPVQCPACVLGMARNEYKRLNRLGQGVAEAAVATVNPIK